MKSLKEIGNFLFIKELIIIAICAFIGVAALGITFLIPNSYMRDNAIESSVFLRNEGTYPHIWEGGSGERWLDYYTDGLMLNVAYTTTENRTKDVLLDTHVYVDEQNPMISIYEVLGLSSNDYEVQTYGRYWHGYIIILRPLMCFFAYQDIYQINMIFQLALVFAFVYILAKSTDKILIIPFFGMYVFLSPISLFGCLQFSVCFYIMMFALIALFLLKKYLNDTTRNYLFLLTGIATAYFDLLTYPLITLGVPLIAYLWLDCKNLTSGDGILNGERDKGFLYLLYTVSWGVGYGGMWASKWLIASIITEENIISNALGAIKMRSDFYRQYSYFETLKLNFRFCNIQIYSLALICMAVFIIVLKIKKHLILNKKLIPCMCAILSVTIYPFIWYLFTQNHSMLHYWFTYREMAISVFGIFMIGVIIIKMPNRESRNE